VKLRTKLSLALLFISLVSASLVGGIAYWMLLRDFDQSMMDHAFANFQQDVASYVRRHGSWEAGAKVERFHDFVLRERVFAGGRPSVSPPPEPPAIDRNRMPPFNFSLIDGDGRVIKGSEAFPLGETVSRALRREARPVVVDGRIVAYALPEGTPQLTPQDRQYLDTMRKALQTGVAVAAVLAVVLGLLFGRRMSRALDALTTAIRAMSASGEIPKPVAIRSRDEIGELGEAFNRMSAELTEAHAELRELSIRDPLTQLFNRRHFDAQAAVLFAQATRYGHPLSVMIGDLDHFKQINDSLSHATGDEVLRRVATVLRDETRKGDVVARWGGEEFVVAFAHTDAANARQRCEELRQRIEAQPWADVVPELRVTISIGVCGDLTLGSVEKMLNAADAALYSAKAVGRNRVEEAVAA